MSAPAGALLARLVGVGLVFGSAAMTVMSFVPPPLPWNRTLHVTVASTAFGEMNPDAGVELGGVRVGKVERIDYGEGGAMIHLAIDPMYAGRLHTDATATIQPHGLLGPKYVALGPGSNGRLAEGALIPRSRTVVTTDFDQVLNSLQPDVRQNLKVIFVELGTASENRGTDMNQAFASLSRAADDARTTTSILQTRQPDTTTFINSSEVFNRDVQYAPVDQSIRDTNRVLTALVQVEDDLGGSIDHTAGVLEKLNVVMAGNSANLAYLLGHAPKTVSRLNHYLEINDALVAAVRPSLPNLLTATVEGESVVGGHDANGHYVRVMALSGACTAAPDPSGSCSSPKAPDGSSAPGPTGPAPTGPGTDQDLPPLPIDQGSKGITDAQFTALLLGG
ncbi:MAG: MCE family protein [Candidatus Dormibacteraceae bacterium]